MNRAIPSLAGLILTGLASISLAQDTFDPNSTREIPQGDLASQPVTRCLSGFFTENFRRDVLALHGSIPVLLHSPGTYQSLIAYEDRDANDIALTDKQPGGFALVGSTGLSFVRYSQGEFTTQDNPCTLLVDASRLVVADLDGDGVDGVAAVGASGTELILVVNAASTGIVATTVNLVSPVLAIAAADLRGDAASEVVVVHATEMLVLDGAGTPIETHPSVPLSSADLIPFRQAGHPKERMALIARPTAGTHDFVVVLSTKGEPLVDAGPAGIFSATAGRADADADEDLVLLSWTYDDAIVLFNQAQGAPPSTTPTFVESEKEVVGFLGSLGSSGAADPICADFDADGDEDLLLLDSEVNSFTILPGVEFSPAPQRVSLLDLDLGFFVLWESKQEAELQITYALPQSPLAGGTDLEFTVWRQPEQSPLLESDALQLEYHELDENTQQSSFRVTIPDASLNLNDTYILEVRLVQRVTGTVVAAGPTWSGSFRPSAIYSELLAENPSEIEAIPVYVVPLEDGDATYQGNGPGSDPEFDDFRRQDSGIIPLPGLPPHDDEPQVPPLGA